jgi:hypothetical protein
VITGTWLKVDDTSANNEVCDFLEAGYRYANATVMANTLDDLAIVVDLPQLALSLVLIAAMNHQIIHNHAKAGADTECIFYELMGLHETPFTSTRSGDYMQSFRQTQPISIIWLSISNAIMPIVIFIKHQKTERSGVSVKANDGLIGVKRSGRN